MPVGCRVTLQCRIRRRSWATTKKQYRTPKVSVGTVKKSIAAITSGNCARKPASVLPVPGPLVLSALNEIQFGQRGRIPVSAVLREYGEHPRSDSRPPVKDQLTYFFWNSLSSHGAPMTGKPVPIHPESGAMPANYGFRSDDQQSLFPFWPHLPESTPKQAIKSKEPRSWPSALQTQDLLA